MNETGGPDGGDRRESATGDALTGEPAAALDEALSTLSDPNEETAPGTEAHRSAAATLATLASERPAAVASAAGTLWAAAERAMDAEEEWTSAERTDEQRAETLAAARAALLETLLLVATEQRAHPELVRGTCTWLRAGDRRRLDIGLRLAERIAGADPLATHQKALAAAFQPVAGKEHEAVTESETSLVEALEENPAIHSSAYHLTSNWELIEQIVNIGDILSSAAVETLAEAESSDVIRDTMDVQYQLIKRDPQLILNSASQFLETITNRELIGHDPKTAGTVSWAVLHSLQSENEEYPFVSSAEPKTVELAAQVLARTALERPDLTVCYRLLGKTAKRQPELLTKEVESLLTVTEAIEDPETRVELLRGIGSVAEESPGTVAEHVDRLAELLDDKSVPVATNLVGVLGEVSNERPAAAAPHVDSVAEVAAGSDDQRLLKNTVGLLANVAAERPDAVLGARDAVLDCLDATVYDDIPEEWLEVLHELVGDEVDERPSEVGSTSLVDEIERRSADDPPVDVPVEDCVSTLADALGVEPSVDSGGDGSQGRQPPDTTHVTGERAHPDVWAGSSRPRPETALRSLATVAEDRPLRVVPHLPLVARAVETFQTADRISSALRVLAKVAEDHSEEVATHVKSVIGVLDPEAPDHLLRNALVTLQRIAAEHPEPVAPHVGRVARIARLHEDVVRSSAVYVLKEVSNEEPGAVVDHLPLLVEELGGGGLSQQPATVTLYRMAEGRPAAVAEYVEEMVESLDTDDPNRWDGGVVEVLNFVADRNPETIEPHVDSVVTLITSEDAAVAAQPVRILKRLATDHDHETVCPHLDTLAGRLDEELAAASAGEVKLTEDSFSEDLISNGLATLGGVAHENPEPVRRHVTTLVAAAKQSPTVRMALWATTALVPVAEEYPTAVGPHVESLVDVMSRYDDPELVRAVTQVEEAIPEHESALDAERILQLVEYAVATGPERLVDEGDPGWFLSQACVAVPADPDAAVDYAEPLARLTAAVDNRLLLGLGLYALSELADEHPEAVAPHVDVVERAFPEWFLGADDPTRYALGLLAEVALSDVEAVAPHVDGVAAVLDTQSEVPETSLWDGMVVLARVGVEYPDRLLPHVDLLARCVDELADKATTYLAVRALMTAAADDPERLNPHVDRLARPIREQTGSERERVLNALLSAQWSVPGVKPVLLDILQAALPDQRSTDPELWRAVQTGVLRVTDGSEPPAAVASATDLLGRTGSTVGPPGD